MIKRVAKYQTSDGKLLDSEVEAREHENGLTALKELNNLLRSSITTGRADAVIRHLLLEEVSVREILYRYHRRIPQKAVVSQKAA